MHHSLNYIPKPQRNLPYSSGESTIFYTKRVRLVSKISNDWRQKFARFISFCCQREEEEMLWMKMWEYMLRIPRDDTHETSMPCSEWQRAKTEFLFAPDDNWVIWFLITAIGFIYCSRLARIFVPASLTRRFILRNESSGNSRRFSFVHSECSSWIGSSLIHKLIDFLPKSSQSSTHDELLFIIHECLRNHWQTQKYFDFPLSGIFNGKGLTRHVTYELFLVCC